MQVRHVPGAILILTLTVGCLPSVAPGHARPSTEAGAGLLERARKLYKQRRYRESLVLYQQAGETRKYAAEAQMGSARIWYRLNKRDQALTSINRALKINSRLPGARKWKAKILLSMGKYQEAIDSVGAEIAALPARHPKLLSLLSLRAGAYSAIGRDREALGDLSRSLSIESNSNTYVKRAQAYVNLGKYRNAVADYTSAINHRDSKWKVDAVYYRRANCYKQLGMSKEAIGDYTKLIENNPYDDEARAKRASLYLEIGKLKLALADAASAIDNYPLGEPPARLFCLRARIYRKMGKLDLARADQRRCLKKD